jgi:hypothetical protein
MRELFEVEELGGTPYITDMLNTNPQSETNILQMNFFLSNKHMTLLQKFLIFDEYKGLIMFRTPNQKPVNAE